MGWSMIGAFGGRDRLRGLGGKDVVLGGPKAIGSSGAEAGIC
jgi:hypothetical protein